MYRYILAFSLALFSVFYCLGQEYHCFYYPVNINSSFNYISEDYPYTRTEIITDTSIINGYTYYELATYGAESEYLNYWIRPDGRQVYLLNPHDSTESILFDFEAEVGESWAIPYSESPPYNQAYWGDTIIVVGKGLTVYNANRTFYKCYKFAHLNFSCFDCGLTHTYFAPDFGKVQFAETTEGCVLDWYIEVPSQDTATIDGIFDGVGNPCYTIPCLPGIAFAVNDNDFCYVLTVNDNWFSFEFSWGDYTPQLNDSIRVTGVVTERMDILGDEYLTIEILALQPINPNALADQEHSNKADNIILMNNFPNPFNPRTTIRFYLTKAEKVSLAIYNISGKKIRTLIQQKITTAGHHEIQWDGMNSNGEPVPSGIYLYQLINGQRMFEKKMLLIK